jgi:uncharacterized protein involved in exopolysaccharide biosynthesis
VNDERKPKATPRDVLRIVARRWGLFLLGASLFAIVALMVSLWWPVKYTGTAKFTRRVDPAAEQLIGPKSESFETRKLTLQNDLSGDNAVERAVEALGLMRNLPRTPEGRLTQKGETEKQELIAQTKKNIKIDWEVRAEQVDLVAVSFTHSDPELAEKVPNTLVSNYFAWVSKQIVDRLSASEEFLKDQKDKCGRQLDTNAAEKVQFEKAHAGAMPERPGMLEDQIRKIESDLDSVNRQLTIAQKKLNRLKSPEQLAAPTTRDSQPATATMPVFSPEYERAKLQLREAKDLLEDMRTVRGMTDKHPEVIAHVKKIEQLESTVKILEEQASKGYVAPGDYSGASGAMRTGDPMLEQALLQIEIDTLTNDRERLEQWRDQHKDLASNIGPIAQEYDSINRRLRDKEEEMKKWEAQYQGVQMALAAEAANRRTHHDSILVAQPQYRPSSPSLLVVLGLALAGGLGFGGALVFMANGMDRSIATADDAAKWFDVPVYGVIGEIVTARQRARRRLKKWILAPLVSILVLAALGLSALSVVLWLQYPEKYKDWKQSPIHFVASEIVSQKP